MTERLYYRDSYLAAFEARVVETADEGRRVYLDRTALYPASGGQPADAGTIAGIPVLDVIDEEDRVAHLAAAAVPAGVVPCAVDWGRRFDHMQQHTGQHLLSAVLVELFGVQTLSFHLGADASTIEVGAGVLDPHRVEAAERRANELVSENRPVTVTFEDAGGAEGLRKPSGRGGVLRVVGIAGYDRSACGGTHVRSTAEIGPILIRKQEKIRGNVRLEFLCGWRALKRVRADFELLSRVARSFSASLDEAPLMVESHLARAQEAEKAARRLSAELAALRGRELYRNTVPGADGIRRVFLHHAPGGLDDDLRSMAQAFAAGERAVFVAITQDPPSMLVTVSSDSGAHAGNAVKAALTGQGGRGGGSATAAQGSVGSREALAGAVEMLRAAGLITAESAL